MKHVLNAGISLMIHIRKIAGHEPGNYWMKLWFVENFNTGMGASSLPGKGFRVSLQT